MSRIPDETVKTILDRTDIVAVIGERVRLEKKGGRYWGLCPFHGEKSASFSVDPDKGFYYCFGCRKGGSPVTFLMELEKLGYREALEELAGKAGIPIELEEAESEEGKQRKSLLELYERVSATFHWFLKEHPSGHNAAKTLSKRGIDKYLLDHFCLGYAPQDRRWLYSFLKKKGYSPEFLAKSGLFAERYPEFPLFCDRLLFPIADQRGRVIAFGGRLLSGEGPKYINSPDTQIFKKQENLFALDKALSTIKKEGKALICEGYMDALSFHAAGIAFAVAPLGTAFTEKQARLIKRWADSVIIAFDSDDAGLKATERACVISASVGLDPLVAAIPGGKDASEILEKEGIGSLQKLPEFTINGSEFLVRRAASLFDIVSIEGKAKAAAFLHPYIGALDSEVKKDAFFDIAGHGLRADPRSLRSDYENARSASSRSHASFSDWNRDSIEMKRDAGTIRKSSDFVLLSALVIHAELFATFRAHVALEDIDDSRAKDLYIALEESFRADDTRLDAVLSRIVDEGLRSSVLERAATGEFAEKPEAFVLDGASRIRIRSLEQRRADLLDKMKGFEVGTVEIEGHSLNDLLYEMMHLDAELAKMKGMLDERS